MTHEDNQLISLIEEAICAQTEYRSALGVLTSDSYERIALRTIVAVLQSLYGCSCLAELPRLGAITGLAGQLASAIYKRRKPASPDEITVLGSVADAVDEILHNLKDTYMEGGSEYSSLLEELKFRLASTGTER